MYYNPPSRFSDIALLPLADAELAKGFVDELTPLHDFCVRILPMLGPLPAIFGLHIAMSSAEAPHTKFKEAERAVRPVFATPPEGELLEIIVEVLKIFGIATKQFKQGSLKKFLKRVAGRTDLEDAEKRLNTLTQEEAQMALAVVLRITRGSQRSQSSRR
ncbi:hypothetical protein V8E53_002843 [Lactarius tabidus]